MLRDGGSFGYEHDHCEGSLAGHRFFSLASRGQAPLTLSFRHTLPDEVPLMNRILCRVLLAAVAAASACSSSETPPHSSSEAPPGSGGETVRGFRTSQPHYDARLVADAIEIDIPYVYRNVTGDLVYFINCNEIIVPSLEKRTGDTWSSVWTGATPACMSRPVVVPPDGEYMDTVRVHAGRTCIRSSESPISTARTAWSFTAWCIPIATSPRWAPRFRRMSARRTSFTLSAPQQ